jgi:hypothetical protein
VTKFIRFCFIDSYNNHSCCITSPYTAQTAFEIRLARDFRHMAQDVTFSTVCGHTFCILSDVSVQNLVGLGGIAHLTHPDWRMGGLEADAIRPEDFHPAGPKKWLFATDQVMCA